MKPLGLNPSKTSINYPCHQEISWLYAAAHNNNKDFERLGLQSIYWHHATNFYQNELEKRKAQDVISELPEGELKIIYERINNLINNFKFDFDISKYIDTSSCDDDVDNSIPKLFEYNANNKQLDANFSLRISLCFVTSRKAYGKVPILHMYNMASRKSSVLVTELKRFSRSNSRSFTFL